MQPIGIVGIGVMGRTVGAKFAEHGIRVFGYDANAACAARGGECGIEMCADLRELAGKVDRFILFLPGPPEIADCLLGEGGLFSLAGKGAVVVDMCTSSPDFTRRMAETANAAGIGYIDAPVLGRPATVGTWALPVGGDAGVMDACLDHFRIIAKTVVHMGGPGSGHTVKLLNQLMFGAINAMTAEMMAVADRVGVAPARLYDIIVASGAGTVSNLFRELGRRIGDGDHDDPTFSVNLLIKDVRLGVEMADRAGSPLILGRAVDFLNQAAGAQGYGALDTSVMWNAVRNLWREPPAR